MKFWLFWIKLLVRFCVFKLFLKCFFYSGLKVFRVVKVEGVGVKIGGVLYLLMFLDLLFCVEVVGVCGDLGGVGVDE